ncbi:MAG: DNA mismatch repair protein MutS [Bacteroidales bacterium]|nr:DNA mismatch repair protein MutS [Bacteroidales bacterium]
MRDLKLKHAIEELEGMRYMIECLPLQAAPTRRYLMALPWLTNAGAMELEFGRCRQAIGFMEEEADLAAAITLRLHQLRDIHGTLAHIAAGNTPDDIELFELKHAWLLADDIRQLMQRSKKKVIDIPETYPVLQLLDPEATRVPTFYIYDCYDTLLAGLRQQVAVARREGRKDAEELLRDQILEREIVVRQRLGDDLHRQSQLLNSTMEALVLLDLVLAKAVLVQQMDLSLPAISRDGQTTLHQMFNPQIKALLKEKGKAFQPVSITLDSMPVLITGANMGGKSVLLKTIALVQMLAQFGFPVPALKAQISPVKQVMISSGDSQSLVLGLSSFGAEVKRLDAIIKAARKGHQVLALIDEPARTTNPDEGEALARALVELLSRLKVKSVVTTHYNGHRFKCRKMRVKGFCSELPQNLTPEAIGNFFDYTLEPDNDTLPRHDALLVASLLGLDEELIQLADQNLNNRKTEHTR